MKSVDAYYDEIYPYLGVRYPDEVSKWDVEVPEELIYAYTDAELNRQEAEEELDKWAVTQGFNDFFDLVSKHNSEVTEQARQERLAVAAKQRRPSVTRATVVDG